MGNENETTSIDTRLALMAQDIKYTNRQLDEINTKVNSAFVSKEEFAPVKERVESIIRALLWVVGLLVVGIVGALLKVILK